MHNCFSQRNVLCESLKEVWNIENISIFSFSNNQQIIRQFGNASIQPFAVSLLRFRVPVASEWGYDRTLHIGSRDVCNLLTTHPFGASSALQPLLSWLCALWFYVRAMALLFCYRQGCVLRAYTIEWKTKFVLLNRLEWSFWDRARMGVWGGDVIEIDERL